MNPIARFVATRPGPAWGLAILAAAIVGFGGSELARLSGEQGRLSSLETEVERSALEVESSTLNGNIIGAMGTLGLVDFEFKQEAQGALAPNGERAKNLLESIAKAHEAEGVFIVGSNGIVKSSWDSGGKPATGIDVTFRPYFKTAMQGKNSIYAAVSLSTGMRALYFAAPLYIGNVTYTAPIGAVVARGGLDRLDKLLAGRAHIALLLSPQGVVFASTRTEWVGHLAGKPTPERIRDIRELKQFGTMFDGETPAVLPMTVKPGMISLAGKKYALAQANVAWNDPFGDWTLVLMEDLTQTVSVAERARVGGATVLAALLLTALLLLMMRASHAKAVSRQAFQANVEQQNVLAQRKSRLADSAMKLQQASNPEMLAQRYLHEMHEMFDVVQGALYFVDADAPGQLGLAAKYGGATDLPQTIAFGEGLLGQCAVERKPIHLDWPTQAYWRISSGLGEAMPRMLVILPILLNETVLGVVELAALHALQETERDALGELLPQVALNLIILRRNQATEVQLSAVAAAEQVKTEQLAFQQALVDTIPYPVFYKDADTRFSGFNRAYEAAFDIKREDLIGKRVLDLDYLPEADRIAYQAEDEATVASAGTINREMKIPFADGKLHDTLYYVAGFRRTDGSPGGLVGTFIDISKMKSAERELERLADAERFNRLALGREERILDLKKEVNALAAAAGTPAPYTGTLIETVADHLIEPHPDYRTDIDEGSQPLRLEDLVDLDELQRLFSAFCESVGIAAAIINLDAKVLASSRWQRACTDFHRVNEDSCARCIESDTGLALKLEEGQDFTIYKCKNGMTDCASPIIVEGQHLANVFIGQFHLGPPDLVFFAGQARQFGYNEADYLQAIAEAPVVDEKRLPVILEFLTGFARMVSTTSLARKRADAAQVHLREQAELLKRERLAAMSLAADAEQARQALEGRNLESKS